MNESTDGRSTQENGTPPDMGPQCPNCGGDTVQRVSGKTGRPFWGCMRYPDCRGLVDPARATPEETRDEAPALDYEWRRNVASQVLLRLFERADYWGDDRRDIGSIAVEITDEFILALARPIG